MTLVDILVNILDGLERGSTLHIDVALILPDQIWTIRNHPAVVYIHIISANFNFESPSIVTSTIRGIRVFREGCGMAIRLREVLGALAILHASCLMIILTTGGVNHDLCNSSKELRLSVRARNLSRYKRVYILWSAKLVFRSKEDDHMQVGQATFLKLNSVNASNSSAQSIFLEYVI
jgi:hypothetical protein